MMGKKMTLIFNPGNTIQNGTADGHQAIQVPRTPHAHLDHFSENLPLPLTQSSHLDLDSIESFPSLRDPSDLSLPTIVYLWKQAQKCGSRRDLGRDSGSVTPWQCNV